MTVRRVKSKGSVPPESGETTKPEPEAPEPGSRPQPSGKPDADVLSARRPEARKAERDRGGHSAPVRVKRHKGTLTIVLPPQSFAPIKYGSFGVASVGMTIEIDEYADNEEEIDALEQDAIKAIQELQEQLFKEELATYLDRAKRAYEAGQKTFGER